MKITTPKLKPETVRLLRRIQKKILAEPSQFIMRWWFTTEHIESNRPIKNCGTAACIGGWAVTLSDYKNPEQARESTCNSGVGASGILKLNSEQGTRLFCYDIWPQKFQKMDFQKEGTMRFARNAARRIDHFIKTGGQE
jgi:hypothetical protein